jgi:hypothetical protein
VPCCASIPLWAPQLFERSLVAPPHAPAVTPTNEMPSVAPNTHFFAFPFPPPFESMEHMIAGSHVQRLGSFSVVPLPLFPEFAPWPSLSQHFSRLQVGGGFPTLMLAPASAPVVGPVEGPELGGGADGAEGAELGCVVGGCGADVAGARGAAESVPGSPDGEGPCVLPIVFGCGAELASATEAAATVTEASRSSLVHVAPSSTIEGSAMAPLSGSLNVPAPASSS